MVADDDVRAGRARELVAELDEETDRDGEADRGRQ